MTLARPRAPSVAAATLATQRRQRSAAPRVRWRCAQLKERTRLALTRRGVARAGCVADGKRMRAGGKSRHAALLYAPLRQHGGARVHRCCSITAREERC
jgi:hypothetical protein